MLMALPATWLSLQRFGFGPEGFGFGAEGFGFRVKGLGFGAVRFWLGPTRFGFWATGLGAESESWKLPIHSSCLPMSCRDLGHKQPQWGCGSRSLPEFLSRSFPDGPPPGRGYDANG